MGRKKHLTFLKQTPTFYHVGGTTGYGSCGTLLCVDSEGITYLGSMSGFEIRDCGPFTIEEFNELKKKLENDEAAIEEVESLMLQNGCEAGKQYWYLDPEFSSDQDDLTFFQSYEEALQELGETMDCCANTEKIMWDDMDESELEDWAEIVQGHLNGE